MATLIDFEITPEQRSKIFEINLCDVIFYQLLAKII